MVILYIISRPARLKSRLASLNLTSFKDLRAGNLDTAEESLPSQKSIITDPYLKPFTGLSLSIISAEPIGAGAVIAASLISRLIPYCQIICVANA